MPIPPPTLDPLLVMTRIAIVVALFTTPGYADRADPDEHYQKAVELAQRGELEEARAEFEIAYQLSPHPAVLYALAKIALEQGDRDSAVRYLTEYLQSDPAELPSAQLDEVRAALRSLEAELPPKEDADSEVKPPPETGSNVEQRPAARAANSETPALELQPPPASQRFEAGAQREPSGTAVGQSAFPNYLLAGTGTALILAGGAVWMWNDANYDRLVEERTALAVDAPGNSDDDAFERAVHHARAVGENEAGFRSVRHFDVVSWSLIGTGAGLLATGLWMLFVEADSDVAVRPAGGGVSAAW